MFVYCFDEEEKMKLQKKFKIFKETQLGDKHCWVFLFNKDKFSLDDIDKSKCVVTERMNF
jgi:hypothetical protein